VGKDMVCIPSNVSGKFIGRAILLYLLAVRVMVQNVKTQSIPFMFSLNDLYTGMHLGYDHKYE
jgi:hypothetical protein